MLISKRGGVTLNADQLEAKQWMQKVRGGLLTQIRMRIDRDPVAMQKAGRLLKLIGVDLHGANVFALTLVLQSLGGTNKTQATENELTSEAD